eukprot:gb/GEZN01008169.1/.p1 GENE.gb/GEZN01008169.1/~~gb/GEZN01008169.1/.p1  ORF type:complete len:186 (+),score=24.49 gb/GEZN01008169.1/:642-1199(+)
MFRAGWGRKLAHPCSRSAAAVCLAAFLSCGLPMVLHSDVPMSDEAKEEVKRGPFRRYFYQGIEVHKLLDLSHAELMKLFPARARRRFARGSVPMHLLKRLRKAKKEAVGEEKPKTIKTHMRNMIIVPEMVASVVGVYNGKSFTQVEIKPNMIGHYLAEFSITYKPVAHAKPGGGSTKGSRFVPLS